MKLEVFSFLLWGQWINGGFEWTSVEFCPFIELKIDGDI